MSSDLSVLESLVSEIDELRPTENGSVRQTDIWRSADDLLLEFIRACSRYVGTVTASSFGSRKPESTASFDEDVRSWQRETEAVELSRRNAHNVLIDAYRILTRFCQRHRSKPLTIEAIFNPDAHRTRIGDLAHIIYRAIKQAGDHDRHLFARLQRSPGDYSEGNQAPPAIQRPAPPQPPAPVPPSKQHPKAISRDSGPGMEMGD